MKKEFTFVGWIIFLGFMYLLTKSRAGYNLVFYGLVLILVLLMVGQYKAIENISIKEVKA